MSEEIELYKKSIADLTEQRDTANREAKALAQQVTDLGLLLDNCKDQGIAINDGMVQNARAIKAEDAIYAAKVILDAALAPHTGQEDDDAKP